MITHAWDVENRLASVVVGVQTTQFQYDADGQRTLTILPNGTEIYTPFPDYQVEVRDSNSPHVVGTIAISGNNLRLNWVHENQNDRYKIYYHPTQPYFNPGTSGSTLLATLNAPATQYTHLNAAHNLNGYYVIVAENELGSYISNRMGIFGFPLVAGTIGLSGADIRLDWTHQNQNSSYKIYHHDSDPYLDASTPGSTLLETLNGPANQYTHSNATGSANDYYVIVAANGLGAYTSNKMGEFNFPIVPGGSPAAHALDQPTTLDDQTAAIPQSAPAVPQSETEIARTTYMLNGQLIAVRVSGDPDSTNNGLFYTYTDHLGNVSALSDMNGTFKSGSFALYRPFGDYRLEPTTNPDITDLGYTGHQENRDLGLTYMRSRYYLPEINRFASPDSIVPDAANPQQLNRYTYSLNNPINYSDPTGHIPVWDIVDVIFFGLSAYEFANTPTLGNAGWLALDVVSLAPIVPSAGYLRYGDEGIQLANRISKIVGHIGVEGGQHIVKTINRFDDGGQLASDFLKIGEIPGSQKIIRNLANGAWQTVKGTRFELEYAVKNSDDIAEIGRSLGGGREIDFVLNNGGFVDVKNYNWAADYYQNSNNLRRTIEQFTRQADEYLKHTNNVTYSFKGSVPDAVRAALEHKGVIVEVIP